MDQQHEIGAIYTGNGICRFRVWAPEIEAVELHLLSPEDGSFPMIKGNDGIHEIEVSAEPGAKYVFKLDGEKERPDPASRFQPEGVHGPSQVVDPGFSWKDQVWFGLSLQEYIIYEMHVGTFTEAGTFEAIIPHLAELKDLGITAIELMPVAQFPGERNWGYDGVYPFAAQHSYGGPDGLRRLVNACHSIGLAVILDVVYNHLGPEGNYLWDYTPTYFTDVYRTPWGYAINFDGPQNDPVRNYFLENARYWLEDCHIDALRLDAVHAIYDFSAVSFLEELAVLREAISERCSRRCHLIAESDLNDTRIIRPRELGGFGLDAQWSDDFHHALHTLLTRENDGYYSDFGRIADLGKAIAEGFIYSGEYSEHRKRRHGNSSRNIRARQFVVCAQNHDQIGNRMLGDRLTDKLSFEAQKLAAGVLLLSPFIPMLFMGEEYGEKNPFPYFISHTDADLVRGVQEGRKREFAAFKWKGEPPDPQAPETFASAILDRSLMEAGHHKLLYELYKDLMVARKTIPALAHLSKKDLSVQVFEPERLLAVRRWHDGDHALIACSFGNTDRKCTVDLPDGAWAKVIDSADAERGGPGGLSGDMLISNGRAEIALRPHSFILWRRKTD